MHEWHLLRVVVLKLVSKTCGSPTKFTEAVKKSDVLSSFFDGCFPFTYSIRFDCGCLCSHYINIKSKKKKE